jgi:broad specificity phosphatase PhoE
LNEFGREQARRVARDLRGRELAALYSSDLRRALETAQILGARMGLIVVPEPRLREINLGQWQGMLSTDIESRYPDEYRCWQIAPLTARPPGGEDIPTLAARVLAAINEIIARYPDQSVAVVAHELPIAVIVCRSMGLGLDRLRDLVPQTGAWRQVTVTGVLE